MSFASFEGETRISDLVGRFYTVPEGSPAALRRSVEKALREANPQLTNLRRVPVGTPILVPEVPGVERTGVAAATPPLGKIVGDLTKSLKTAQQSVDESLRRDKAARDQTIELLKARELRDQAKADPDLQEQLSRLTEIADDRLTQSKARAERRLRTLAALGKDLEEFERNPGAAFAATESGGLEPRRGAGKDR
jgi:hypothetical protein